MGSLHMGVATKRLLRCNVVATRKTLHAKAVATVATLTMDYKSIHTLQCVYR